jgi:hypothetical protein
MSQGFHQRPRVYTDKIHTQSLEFHGMVGLNWRTEITIEY